MRLRPRRRIATIQSVQCFDVARPAADLVFRHPEPVHEAHTEVTTWRGEGVVNPRSFATARDEPGMFQGGKMARDLDWHRSSTSTISQTQISRCLDRLRMRSLVSSARALKIAEIFGTATIPCWRVSAYLTAYSYSSDITPIESNFIRSLVNLAHSKSTVAARQRS